MPGRNFLVWLAAIAALVISPTLAAQETAPPKGVAEARAGEFRVLQMMSADPAAFMEAWQGPTPPKLPMTSSVQRNERFEQFIMFGNCTADGGGRCLLRAKVTIFDPDGEFYGEPLEFAAWEGPAPPANAFHLARGGLGMVVEDGEKLGQYRIRLEMTDVISGTVLTSDVVIDVTEAEPPATSVSVGPAAAST